MTVREIVLAKDPFFFAGFRPYLVRPGKVLDSVGR